MAADASRWIALDVVPIKIALCAEYEHARLTAENLAAASALSVATIRRAELKENQTALTSANDLAIRRALESAGVEFIDEAARCPAAEAAAGKRLAQGVIANAGFRYEGCRRSNGSVEQT